MDSLLLKSALQAMKRFVSFLDIFYSLVLTSCRVVKDKQLPMPVNIFFSHVIGCRPQGTNLNIKHSTHKKVRRFSFKFFNFNFLF